MFMFSFSFLDKNRQNHVTFCGEKVTLFPQLTPALSVFRRSPVARKWGNSWTPFSKFYTRPWVTVSALNAVERELAAGGTTDPVDSVADSEKVASLAASTSSFFLQQSDDQRSSVVIVILVSVDHRDSELRVSPECICQRHQTSESIL